MDKHSFYQLVKDQFVELNEINFSDDTDFKKLESYDSLTGMAIIATIEDFYKISIPLDKFNNINKLEELYFYVLNNI
jgi:acyl carrier protein